MSAWTRLKAARRTLAARRLRARATVAGRIGGAVALLAATTFLVVGVLAPPEHCPTVTRAELRASATEAVDWFVRNQRGSGRWLYLYDYETGEVDAEPYNVVRHAGAILGLEQAATAGLPGARASADRGTDWLLGRVIERDDWAAVSYTGEVAVGSSALFLSALAERRMATGDTDHDELMAQLGRFLVNQVEPSGGVLAYYDIRTEAPVPDVRSKYYTGEAYWALARLHRLFPDDGWDEAADRIGHYLATERDRQEGHRLAIPDHWAAYGLAETVGAPHGPGAPEGTDPSGRALTPAERSYARHQSGAFGAQVRWFAQLFGPWGSPTRWFRGVPRGGGYGVVGEALSGLWRVARVDPALADIEGPVAERALCNMGQAIEAQSTAEDAAATGDEDPGRIQGAWYRDGETRMDDQQHMISALLRAEAIAAAAPTGRGAPAPPAWLWLAALVAAMNPLRVAQAVRTPVGGRRLSEPPSPSAARVALGGATGAVAVLATAALADPVASALHMSAPALRLAAGVVGVIFGLVALLVRPSSAAPLGPDRAGTIVPVAVAVASPALFVGALSASLDRGLPVVVTALALGVGALAALVALVPPPVPARRYAPSRLLTRGGRVTGIVLVAASVALIVNAAYAP